MAQTLRIQDVIDGIIGRMAEPPMTETVDVVKTGDPQQPVTGIVTTFLASIAVIQRAVDLGANLIITHEPTFYNHLDDVAWLAEDPIYQAKRTLLDDHQIVVWRLHDRIHGAHKPDGILIGVRDQLGWPIDDPDQPYYVTIPPTSVRNLASLLKQRLGVPAVRVAGPPDLLCERVGLLVGAAPGEWHIKAFSMHNLDVVVCGESREWETCEYVRDANRVGRPAALINVGHAASEEAGMRWVADWLRPFVPGIQVTHVPTGEPFAVL